MRAVLEFWLSLSRLNRIAIDFLLFWFAAGSVLGLGVGAVREFVPPFLTLTVLAGVVGALVAITESIRLVHRQARTPRDQFDSQTAAICARPPCSLSPTRFPHSCSCSLACRFRSDRICTMR